MMVSGVIVAVFIVYHLLHYTAMVQAVNLTGKNFDAKPEFFDSRRAARYLSHDDGRDSASRWSAFSILSESGCCACI